MMAFSTLSFSRFQLIPVLLFLTYILFTLHKQFIRGFELDNGETFLVLLASALSFIYLIAPAKLGEGSYFNDRCPWVILLIISPVIVFTKRLGHIIIVTSAFATIVINSVVFADESSKIKTFTSGIINGGITNGDLIVTYTRSKSLVNVVRHASSYYGLMNGCIDIGNYEARSSYFSIQFTKDIPVLPKVFQIESEPWTIDFGKYPKIDYILGWEINQSDRQNILKTHEAYFSNDNLTVFRAKGISLY
jgi:hypothetical protein